MKDANSDRTSNEGFWTVTNIEQAKLLTDATSKAFFKPFLARECTVSRAAEEVGCNVNTMLYRVKTFVRVGLLEVAHIEKRVGRPIRHYRSVHDAYLIPDGVTPYADLEERLLRQIRPFWETLMRSLARAYRERGLGGQYLQRTTTGVVTTSLATQGEGDGLADFWSALSPVYSDMTLDLTPAEAEALAHRLLRILAEASQNIATKELKGSRQYVLQVALVPSE